MSVPATNSGDAVLPGSLTLGPIELTVTDLDRSISFYEDVIGLTAGDRGDRRAELGTGGPPIVVLVEEPGARRPGRESGLYHYALLFGDRAELARAAVRIGETKTSIQGASDHHTHEAIYLPDPDGNGIELAADRPRDQWPDRMDPGWLTEGPDPLDVEDLLAQIAGEPLRDRAADGLRVGHVHLHVGELEPGLEFYRDTLGFEQQALLETAAFLSAGGYHHHVAFNLWRGAGAPPATSGVLGLRHWTIEIDSESLAAVRRRLDDAGVASSPFGEGILVRDPFNIAVAIVPSNR